MPEWCFIQQFAGAVFFNGIQMQQLFGDAPPFRLVGGGKVGKRFGRQIIEQFPSYEFEVEAGVVEIEGAEIINIIGQAVAVGDPDGGMAERAVQFLAGGTGEERYTEA